MLKRLVSGNPQRAMIGWLSARKAEAFGVEMAQVLMTLLPNDAAPLTDKKRASKANYAKEKMRNRVRQFAENEVLNFYKTAKLLNRFKWALKDAGYDDAVADSFAAWMLNILRSANA